MNSVFACFFSILFIAGAASATSCADELLERLCGPSTSAAQTYYHKECNCPVSWTSVPATFIGTVKLQHVATSSYTIPSVIPDSAKEVLIYAGVFCGHSSRGPGVDLLKIFTQIESTRYEKYIMLYSWNQDAYNTNSDNMWFPMPPNRRIYFNVPFEYGPNAGAQLFAIGYR